MCADVQNEWMWGIYWGKNNCTVEPMQCAVGNVWNVLCVVCAHCAGWVGCVLCAVCTLCMVGGWVGGKGWVRCRGQWWVARDEILQCTTMHCAFKRDLQMHKITWPYQSRTSAPVQDQMQLLALNGLTTLVNAETNSFKSAACQLAIENVETLGKAWVEDSQLLF